MIDFVSYCHKDKHCVYQKPCQNRNWRENVPGSFGAKNCQARLKKAKLFTDRRLGMIDIFVYDKSTKTLNKIESSNLDTYLGQKNYLMWIDFFNASMGEKKLFREKFGFHPISITDCFGEKAFPKISDYKDYVYIRVHGLSVKENNGKEEQIRTASLSAFIGNQTLVTYHKKNFRSINFTKQRIFETPSIIGIDTEFLYYHILDELVDDYIPVLDKLDQRIEAAEDKIFEGEETTVIDDVFALKKMLTHLRKIFYYQKEVIHKIGRDKFDEICENCTLYFRNVYDHMNRISDLSEMYRDLTTSILDVSISLASKKLNDVMKVLTIFASVLLPLSVIVGIFGMNFKNLPWLESKWGFPSVMIFMATVASCLLYYFRRKKWL